MKLVIEATVLPHPDHYMRHCTVCDIDATLVVTVGNEYGTQSFGLCGEHAEATWAMLLPHAMAEHTKREKGDEAEYFTPGPRPYGGENPGGI